MKRYRAGAQLAVALLCAGGMGLSGTAHAAPSAEDIYKATGIRGGVVVQVGCGDGVLTSALGANAATLVQGLDVSAENVRAARQSVRAAGRYGRVNITLFNGTHLPYIDNFVNLVVSENLGKVSMDEVMRVLCPEGMAYIKVGDTWKTTVKPRPEEISAWTHYMYDATGNAVAQDSVVGPPGRLQWEGSPKWGRHHEHMSSISACVSSGKRIFYIVDEGSRFSIFFPPEWKLVARDSFNGTILWKRPIDEWYSHMMRLKSGPSILPRRLVAVGERVYVTLGINSALTALDAATGETVLTYEDTVATQELIVSDGIIFLVANKSGVRSPTGQGAKKNRSPIWRLDERRLMAIEADSGKLLWQKTSKILPMSPVADKRHVYFNDGDKVICLDRKNGKELWASEALERLKRLRSFFGAKLVVHNDVVLFTGGKGYTQYVGSKDTMTALDAGTGKTLWTKPHPSSGYASPEDLFVVDGLVWTGNTSHNRASGNHNGRNLRTGLVEAEIKRDLKGLFYWFHHRCYPAKATKKYLLISQTGIEFYNLETKTVQPHHWTRGTCLYGVMPCNGLVYNPSHPCACYPESKQSGFSVLAPALPDGQNVPPIREVDRLVKGSAYGPAASVSPPDAKPGNAWPTFRGDNARSGFTRSAVGPNLTQTWKATPGGRLSALVMGQGKILFASIDAHTVHALDAATGKPLWQFIAGGRVDSPPTIFENLVIFGCADGHVYGVRITDGKLVWRFRAGPIDRRLMAYEQLESVWPVHGSVLIQPDASGKDVVYCAAGRSMFLDGGLRFLKLDPRTGNKLSEIIHTGKDLQKKMRKLSMPAALPDIPSSNGKTIFMRSQGYDLDGNRLGFTMMNSKKDFVPDGEETHLFGPNGFLEDSYWHRTYWVYGRSFTGGWRSHLKPGKIFPAGRILLFNDSTVFGYGRKKKYYKWTTPIEHYLFAHDRKTLRTAKQIPRNSIPKSFEDAWGQDIPLIVRAMVLADQTLFIAGPRDKVDDEKLHTAWKKRLKGREDSSLFDLDKAIADQEASWDGKKGAVLWAINAADGKKLSELALETVPIFDGMIAVAGRLYLANTDGTVVCFSGSK